MYGCANGNLVYGWRECEDDNVIDGEWIYYNNIQLFCSYQVKNYASGNAIYGLTCEIDVNTGIPTINETEKQKVQEAYTKFVNFYKENDGDEADTPKLGYYIAVDGDMEWDPYSIINIPFDGKSEDDKSEDGKSEDDKSEDDKSEDDKSEDDKSEDDDSKPDFLLTIS